MFSLILSKPVRDSDELAHRSACGKFENEVFGEILRPEQRKVSGIQFFSLSKRGNHKIPVDNVLPVGCGCGNQAELANMQCK